MVEGKGRGHKFIQHFSRQLDQPFLRYGEQTVWTLKNTFDFFKFHQKYISNRNSSQI